MSLDKNTYPYTKKILASLSICMIVAQSIGVSIFANTLTGFEYFSDLLKSQGVISRDYIAPVNISRLDALRISVGIGGWPSGCSATPTLTCDIESIAKARGLSFAGLGNIAIGTITRANAIRLVLQARGIPVSTNPSGYSDVDDQITKVYVGYISKAREMGCIQTASTFRPFDATTEGEFAKMAVCSVESDEGGLVLDAAPSTGATVSSTPTSFPIFSSTPSGTPVYYGGGGGGTTTVVNNYYTNAFSGAVDTLTVSGAALFLGNVDFSTLPSFPLTYGGVYVGNSSNRASVLAAGSTGQVLSMLGGIPTWVSIGSFASSGGLVDSVFGRTGSILAQAGDYTTDLVTESSNLYFTNLRAQNALSGTISGITTNISALSTGLSTLSSAINTLSGIVWGGSGSAMSGALTDLTNTINTLSGQVATLTNTVNIFGFTLNPIITTVNSFSGTVGAQGANILALSGGLALTDSNLAFLSGSVSLIAMNLASLSGVVTTFSTDIMTLSGGLMSTNNAITTLSGNLTALAATVSSLSGVVSNILSDISTLQTTVSTHTSEISTLSGGLALTNATLATLSGVVSSHTADIATLSGALATTTTNLSNLTTNFATLSGTVLAIGNTLATLSGTVSQHSLDISTLSGVVSTKISLASLSANGPLTYNNLTGVFGMSQASTSTNGYLSSTDWNIFNTKQDSISTGSVVEYYRGDKTWQTLDTSVVPENGNLYWTTGRFDTALSTKSTTNLSEGTNLYFTNLRAQNALSGTITAISASLSNLTTALATATGNILSLQTNLASTTGALMSLSGVVSTHTTDIAGLIAGLTLTNTNIATATGNISTLSGVLSTTATNLSNLTTNVISLSGAVSQNILDITTIQSTISAMSGQLLTLSGNLAALSGALALTNVNLATLSGALSTTNANLASLSGNLSTTNVNLATANTNIASITGQLITTHTNLATATGNILSLQTNLASATGSISGLLSSLATTNANLATATGNILSLSGGLALTNAILNSLSGVVATKISLTNLSANGPLTYNNLTGVFGINIANSTMTGSLSASDWNIFNNKENVLTFNNGLSRVGNTVGIATLTGGMLTGFTSGQLLFGSPTGAITQSGGLFWDNTNGRLGIGTTTPTEQLDVMGNIRLSSGNPTDAIYSTNTGGLILESRGNSFGTVRLTLQNIGASNGAVFEQIGASNPQLVDFSFKTSLAGQRNIRFETRSAFRFTSTPEFQFGIADDPGFIVGDGGAFFRKGNVGIGTATPNTRLEINSGLTGTAGLRFTNLTSSSTASVGNGKFLSLTASGDIILTNIANALTLSGANGLTLSGTDISLGLASATTTGALSATDWSYLFTNLATATGNIFTLSGNLASLSGMVSTTNSNLTTLSGTLATTNTTLTNLTTNFNTLSGTVKTLSGAISSLSGILSAQIINLATLSGSLTTLTTNFNTLSGSFNTLSTNFTTLSGTVFGIGNNFTTLSGTVTSLLSSLALTNTNIASITGQLITINTNIATATGNISTLSGRVNALSGSVTSLQSGLTTTNTNLATATGNILSLQNNLATATGNILTLSGNLASLSGMLATTNSNLSNLTTTVNTLSGTVVGIGNNLTNLTTNVNTLSGNVLTLSNNFTTLSSNFTTLSGTVVNIGNTLTTLSGTVSTLTNQIGNIFPILATATGNILSLQTGLATTNVNLTFATGTIATHTSQISTLFSGLATATGNILSLQTNLASATGSISGLLSSLALTNANLASLSGVVATKISLTNLSANGPLTYNNLTGVFGINIANSTMTGALSASDWNIFNNKENVLTFNNGLSRVGNTVGIGTLTGGMITGFTPGQLVFGSPTNRLTQSNNLFWDNTNGRLGVGTNTPTMLLQVNGNAQFGIGNLINIPAAPLNLINSAGGIMRTQLSLINTGGGFGAGSAIDFYTYDIGGGVDPGLRIGGIDENYSAHFIISTKTPGAANNPLVERFRITNIGNVGIGTTTPTAKLDILDNSLTTDTLMKLTATGLTSGNALQIIGTGSRNLLRVYQNGADPLDVERVTIGQGGISAAKPDSLARDQLYVFGRINTSWDHFSADFLNSTTTLANDAITPEGLQFDRININAGYAVSNVVGISGTRQISVNTNANASALLGAYNVTEAGLSPVYEARAIINTSNATTRAIVGFTDRTLGATTLNTDTLNSTNQIFFRKLAASTTWQAVTRSTANATELITNTTVPVNQWNIFRIEVEGANQVARFYINGTLVATHNGTTVPAATTRLGHQLGLGITNTTANTMDIDYIRMWSDDPAGASNITSSNNALVSGESIASLTGSSILPSFIYTSKQYLGDISFVLNNMGSTSSGAIARTTALRDDGNVTIDEYGNYVLNNLKQSLEKMSDTDIDTELGFRSLRTKHLDAGALCIGETCYGDGELVTKADLLTYTAALMPPTVYNTYTTTQIIQNTTSGSSLSGNISALSLISATLESLFIEGKTIFQEMVTFTRGVIFEGAVTFKSLVTFEDRVIFSDRDMGGVAVIRAGSTRVDISFARAYAESPVVTITPVGHYIRGAVTRVSERGFSIELQSPVLEDIRFNWMAVVVRGAMYGFFDGLWSDEDAPVVDSTSTGTTIDSLSTTGTTTTETISDIASVVPDAESGTLATPDTTSSGATEPLIESSGVSTAGETISPTPETSPEIPVEEIIDEINSESPVIEVTPAAPEDIAPL